MDKLLSIAIVAYTLTTINDDYKLDFSGKGISEVPDSVYNLTETKGLFLGT